MWAWISQGCLTAQKPAGRRTGKQQKSEQREGGEMNLNDKTNEEQVWQTRGIGVVSDLGHLKSWQRTSVNLTHSCIFIELLHMAGSVL